MINVDKVYVLTIQRHFQRRKRIDMILKNINFEYYFGFDAPEYFSDYRFVNQIPADFFETNSIVNEFVNKWNIGQLGAYFSIRKMIQDAYEREYDKILVFEDDIFPLDANFIPLINNSLLQLPENWEIFQLGFEYDGKIYKLAYKRTLRKIVYMYNLFKRIFRLSYVKVLPLRLSKNVDQSGNSFGGHAFILNRKGIKKLLDNMYPLRDGGDVLINKLITEKNINAYSIYPLLFKQVDKQKSSTR